MLYQSEQACFQRGDFDLAVLIPSLRGVIGFVFSLPSTLLGSGITAVVLISGGIYTLVRYSDNIEQIAGWLSRWLRFAGRQFSNRATASDVTQRVNHYASTLRKSVPGYHPPELRLELHNKNIEPEAFLSQDKVVVRLRPWEDRDRNFLAITYLFVSKTLFPSVKAELNDTEHLALDLAATHRLVHEESPGLTSEFVERWVNPALREHPDLEPAIVRLQDIDRAGLFLPVLCQELHHLSGELPSSTRREELRTEVSDFVSYLVRIAERKVGEQVPLLFKGKLLRMAIQIVSASQTRMIAEMKGKGYSPWLRYALRTFAKSTELNHV